MFLFLPFAFLESQETGARIAITPLTFDLSAERGGRVSQTIKVMNSSYERDIRVNMEVEDMFPEGEEGRVVLREIGEDADVLALSRWITFEPEELVLRPREERQVRFTIDVPVNASPGGHYAGIIARTPPGEIEGTGVGIVSRIASLILLTVPGEVEEDLSAISFQTGKGYYYEGPVEFHSRFKNEGTIHLRPDARIEIFDLLGRKVDEIPVEKRNVLPDATRKINTTWEKGWLFGIRYTANLVGYYGEEGKEFEPLTVSFWAFPWKIGLGIFIIVVFFFVTRRRWVSVFRILIFGEKGMR